MTQYFYSDDGKKSIGPLSIEEFEDIDIDKDTLIWFEGLKEWIPAGGLQDFQEILQLQPPPIPSNEVAINEIAINENNISLDENIENSDIDIDESESYHSVHKGMFSNTFSFEGRIRRLEFGLSLIIFFTINMILTFIMGLVGEDAAAIFLLTYIPMYWFLWAQGAKRCHDLGHNGWYQIIPFYFLWLIFQNGESGLVNDYGPNPKN